MWPRRGRGVPKRGADPGGVVTGSATSSDYSPSHSQKEPTRGSSGSKEIPQCVFRSFVLICRGVVNWDVIHFPQDQLHLENVQPRLLPTSSLACPQHPKGMWTPKMKDFGFSFETANKGALIWDETAIRIAGFRCSDCVLPKAGVEHYKPISRWLVFFQGWGQT